MSHVTALFQNGINWFLTSKFHDQYAYIMDISIHSPCSVLGWSSWQQLQPQAILSMMLQTWYKYLLTVSSLENLSSSIKLGLVVPFFFHLQIMDAIVIYCDLHLLQKFFCTFLLICALIQSCTSLLGLCTDIHCQLWYNI